MALEERGFDSSIRRERELVLNQIEFAYVLDKTKGNIICYVGPHKTSLSGTDEPVIYDPINKKFVPCELSKAVQSFITAEEGEYVVLENPAERGEDNVPKVGSNNIPRFQNGRTVNITGPATFPLWPTQRATVVNGHHLRSNQYLIVRVYNEEAAQKNWKDTVVKAVGDDKVLSQVDVSKLTMGRMLVIKGTDVSFYIPPTGVEVLADGSGATITYVRDAVTLENLQYCILLDESGNKRYVRGPEVVFPCPTETFITGKAGSRRFRAIELNDTTGIYIKVIADYTEAGKAYKTGDELFITGKDQTIYYPRAEHALIKYGDQDKHYACAVPAGEGRYLLNRNTGAIELVKGPVMLLPDPRSHVIVKRILDAKQVQLWFPGNKEAMEYNQKAAIEMVNTGLNDTAAYLSNFTARSVTPTMAAMTLTANAKGFVMDSNTEFHSADGFDRKQTYTPPRQITLDTKYDGAVLIKVWPGYAIMVVDRQGNRRVEVGPKPVLLNYDETLESVQLSTGKPKNADRMYETVFLSVHNNKVGDIIEVETKDMVHVDLKLSLKTSFEGDNEKWFSVSNYVKLLTDHVRSVLKGMAKKYGVAELNADYVNIIRDTILGKATTDAARPGMAFDENGLRVTDVEILGFQIKHEALAKLLTNAQSALIEQNVKVIMAENELMTMKKIEAASRAKTSERLATEIAELDAVSDKSMKSWSLKEQEQINGAKVELMKWTTTLELGDMEVKKNLQLIDMKKATQALSDAQAQAELAREIEELEAQTAAVVEKAKAISPDLIAAISVLGERDVLTKVSASMAPLAILGGTSVANVINTMLAGTNLEGLITDSIVDMDKIKARMGAAGTTPNGR